MIQRPGSLKRRGSAALACVIFALVTASAASAWEGYWGQGQYVDPGSYLGSAYNSGLNLSEAYYSPVGNDVMGVTLCTTGGSCYGPAYGNTGANYVQDFRTISYGASFCGGKYNNLFPVFIDYCHTSNAACTGPYCV
jgi:hypothetical protein